MNRQQYLFKLLEEECSEVGQNASKCMRFTPYHTGPAYKHSNLERLQTELTDLFTVIKMLEENLGVTLISVQARKKRHELKNIIT
jgi:NTP pyrophosphatase (non-canonical NTP hydrolase)